MNGISPRSATALGDFAPLVFAQVGAGRVVAAAVEQGDVAAPRRAQRLDHLVEADRRLAALVIGIIDLFEPDRTDDRRMVGPGRRADQHPRVAVGGGDQLEAQPKRAAAAGRLQPGDALVGRRSPKHDRPHQLDEALVAGAAEIGLGRLGLEQAPLGLLHHLEDRRSALAVAEHADADVDLVGPRVGIGHDDQREQRIAGDRRKIGEPRSLGVRQHALAISAPPSSLRGAKATKQSSHTI